MAVDESSHSAPRRHPLQAPDHERVPVSIQLRQPPPKAALPLPAPTPVPRFYKYAGSSTAAPAGSVTDGFGVWDGDKELAEEMEVLTGPCVFDRRRNVKLHPDI